MSIESQYPSVDTQPLVFLFCSQPFNSYFVTKLVEYIVLCMRSLTLPRNGKNIPLMPHRFTFGSLPLLISLFSLPPCSGYSSHLLWPKLSSLPPQFNATTVICLGHSPLFLSLEIVLRQSWASLGEGGGSHISSFIAQCN